MVYIFTMRKMNLNGIDLNLLPPLEALLRLRNVTHAASSVGLSQPAMSRALSRLRDILEDPLLVRIRGGFVLTPKALALVPCVAVALQNMETVFTEPVFDLNLQKRKIRIAATDMQTILFAPLIMARLARSAPHIEVAMEYYGPDISGRVNSGAVDFAFALASTELPAGAKSIALGRDELALVMRRKHPAAKRAWTVADYGIYSHVGISILGDGRSELDAQLATHGVQRRMGLVTPHFMAALASVAVNDMVTTVSKVFAQRFAKRFDLVLMPPPLQNTALLSTLVWSSVHDNDKFLIWFREMVRDVAQNVFESAATGLPR